MQVEWTGLLGFAQYDTVQLEAVRDALALFQPTESAEVPPEDAAPWWAASMDGSAAAD